MSSLSFAFTIKNKELSITEQTTYWLKFSFFLGNVESAVIRVTHTNTDKLSIKSCFSVLKSELYIYTVLHVYPFCFQLFWSKLGRSDWIIMTQWNGEECLKHFIMCIMKIILQSLPCDADLVLKKKNTNARVLTNIFWVSVWLWLSRPMICSYISNCYISITSLPRMFSCCHFFKLKYRVEW